MAEAKKPSGDSQADAMIKAQPYMDAAWQFIGGVLMGALAGWFADKKLHTTPWLLVVGLFLGFAAGFFSLMRVLARLDAQARKSSEDKPKD